MTRGKADLTAAAELVYKQSGVICGNPKLVVMYAPCFVDTEVFSKADNTLQKSANADEN